ncbi:MAG: arylsulfatase [Akkermansiaceae bacterium]|nr:arylsulfatase [Akkermansiaceae bacterium]MCP5544612.1 arylsulfatase [Akkermansiaceae bacterium]
MGIGEVSHNGGKAPTPHIDRLAAEGMRFTDAHTSSSVCTPTRYALLTGRYNWRSPLKNGVLGGTSPCLITHGETILPKMLETPGYRSMVVGKWHLGLGWSKLAEPAKAESGPTKGAGWQIDFTRRVTGGPCDLGFDEDFLFPASLDMAPYVYLRDDKVIELPTITNHFHPNRHGPAVKGMEPEQCLGDFAREARAFIGREARNSDPFFLYLPLTSPHTPISPSKEWQGKSSIGKYGDFLMETDWVVGEVLAELDKNGVSENTLLIFTSDNGCSPAAGIPNLEKKGHFPCGKLRGHKADIYEGGHRVPFLVRWPERVDAGTTSDRTLCQTDIFATVADATGAKPVESTAPDSFSFLPTLEGETQEPRPATIHHSINGSFAIRKGRWKLCLCPGSGGWSEPVPDKAWKDGALPRVQLFDLTEDPGETNNIQDKHPAKVKELVEELAHIINNGRSTPGPKLENHGAIRFRLELTERFPVLE